MRDKQWITASEINEFVYCARKWYHSQTTGRRKLKQMALQRKAKHYTKGRPAPKRPDPREQGIAYHKNHYRKNVRNRPGDNSKVFKNILLVGIIALILAYLSGGGG